MVVKCKNWQNFNFLKLKASFFQPYFISGEYIKDIDKIILPQDPLLNHKFPTPIIERGLCGGVWESMEDDLKEDDGTLYRNCDGEDLQPLALLTSKV